MWRKLPPLPSVPPAHDPVTTSTSRTTAVEPLHEPQPEAVNVGKVNDTVNIFSRARESTSLQADSIEAERDRMAVTMVERVGFQRKDWWKNMDHDWYPFIGSERWIPTSTVDLLSADKDPKDLLIEYATRLGRRSSAVTQGEMFLLACLCQVLKNDVSTATIGSAMRKADGSMTYQMSRDYLGAIAWVGKLMRKLSSFGWDISCIDLLVSCEPQSSFGTARYADTDGCVQGISVSQIMFA